MLQGTAEAGAEAAEEARRLRLRPLRLLLLLSSVAFALYIILRLGGPIFGRVAAKVFGGGAAQPASGSLRVEGACAVSSATTVYVVDCGGHKVVVTESRGEGVSATAVPLPPPPPFPHSPPPPPPPPRDSPSGGDGKQPAPGHEPRSVA